MSEIIIQEPDGDYEIHVPFRAKSSKKYRLIEVPESIDHPDNLQAKEHAYCSCDTQYAACDNGEVKCKDCRYWIVEKVKYTYDPDFVRPYIKSEYEYQLAKMIKIFGKQPDVFEQGVNALIAIVEGLIPNPLSFDQPQEAKQPERTAEEIYEKFLNPLRMVKVQQAKKVIIQMLEEYADQFR